MPKFYQFDALKKLFADSPKAEEIINLAEKLRLRGLWVTQIGDIRLLKHGPAQSMRILAQHGYHENHSFVKKRGNNPEDIKDISDPSLRRAYNDIYGTGDMQLSQVMPDGKLTEKNSPFKNITHYMEQLEKEQKDQIEQPATLKQKVEEKGYDRAKTTFEKGREGRELRNTLSDYGRVIRFKGGNPNETVKQWSDNPETIPEEIKSILQKSHEGEEGYTPTLTNSMLMDFVEDMLVNESGSNFFQALPDQQKKRSEAISEAKDSKTSPEVNFLTGDKGPFNTLWEEMSSNSDVDKRDFSARKLFTTQQIQNTQNLKEKSDKRSDTLSGTFPTTLPTFNYDLNAASFDKAKTLYQTMYGDTPPPETYPFEKRMHQLNLGGHAPGSSSQIKASKDKKQAWRHGDLEGIKQIQQMLMNEHLIGGDTQKLLFDHAKNINKAEQDPVEFAGKTLGNAFNSEDEERRQEQQKNQWGAEQTVDDLNSRIRENAAVMDIKERTRMQDKDEREKSQGLVQQLNLLAAEQDINKAETDMRYEALRDELWAKREDIAIRLRASNMQQEALEIEKAKSKQGFISKILGFGISGIAAGALAFTGNVAPALAILSPTAGTLLSQTQNQRRE